ncbi:Dol-P-Man:Man(7)GlcNAc(2)-PP-Dol alpha-1,6-mannosyltransferase [Vitis vinifera]|uniref:Dol-P-Man:Man(7)GlcNAc(2)-PP-Dol alpha-1,6-mannosyltransferase n=1 Tax=Vitis vinifera TaxID=29760 RepID=A0A438CAA0_VITVI|nr:Dol-P-Man:Man(7)GlcNAc(2)-PP-Dol alpha-1,6-mannosyltransferase [Vitis vinifera]
MSRSMHLKTFQVNDRYHDFEPGRTQGLHWNHIPLSGLYNNRKKSLWKLLYFCLLGLLLISLGCTIITFMASYNNYPSGYGLKHLHQIGESLSLSLLSLLLSLTHTHTHIIIEILCNHISKGKLELKLPNILYTGIY